MKLFNNEIYHHVKAKILKGEFAPGSRINLRTLGQTFNTSRLPIRDALNRLNGEGLVQQRTSGGYFVTPLTEADIRQTYELRAILEGYLAAQAAQTFTADQIILVEENIREQENAREDNEEFGRLNRLFHEIFFQVTSNIKFVTLIRQLRDYQDRFDRINWLGSGRPLINVAFRQHQEILEAVKRKNPEMADRILKLHSDTAVEFLIPTLMNKGMLET